MKTQIIITLGPSSEPPEVMSKLVRVGFDIARVNFSHSTYSKFKEQKKLLSLLARQSGKDIKILQDLQGPRVRVGKLSQENLEVRSGETVVFSSRPEEDNTVIPLDCYLKPNIKIGDPIYIANGKIELVAEKVEGLKIHARVTQGGVVSSRKSVNFPRTDIHPARLTEKDIKDLKFGVREGIHYIAISFVQSAADVKRVRRYVGSRVKVIAKIETAMALENIDEIIRAADGIMIARGDLGIEMPSEQVPFIQKNLIRHAAWHKKPSITATHLLASMVSNPYPTMAEIADISNAVLDGTDAVLLSDETAVGKYPVETLKTLVKVVRKAEEYAYRGGLSLT